MYWRLSFWLKIWSVSFAVISMGLVYSVLAVVWGFVRPTPTYLRGRVSSCLSASHAYRPARAGISWSLKVFSRSSYKSIVSNTVLWKWVQLEHIPLVNAEYAAWGQDHPVQCAHLESSWRSFTQPSTLFLINCSLNDFLPITAPWWRSPSLVCDCDACVVKKFLCRFP